jgi:hypothetical protein
MLPLGSWLGSGPRRKRQIGGCSDSTFDLGPFSIFEDAVGGLLFLSLYYQSLAGRTACDLRHNLKCQPGISVDGIIDISSSKFMQ